MGIANQIKGNKYGRLRAISRIGSNNFNKAIWLFECDCGKKIDLVASSVISGNTNSCGCLHKDNHRTHGKYNMRIYNIWHVMNYRCNNPKNKDYYEKGVKVCEKWLKFEGFYEDMGFSYKENLTLDRIDNSKGYCKENCRWASTKEQSNNKTTNKILQFRGEKRTLSQWAEKFGLKYNTVYFRMYNGWSIEKALTLKPKRTGRIPKKLL
jgi:hypothetical protein